MKVKLFLTLSNAVEETKMVDVKTLFLLLLFCSVSSSAKHDLRVFLTGSYGVPDFHQLFASLMLDGVQLGHFDSDLKQAILEPHWMTKSLKDEPSYLEGFSGKISEMLEFMKYNIELLKDRLHQSGDGHILQLMGNFEWDDETGEIEGSVEFGYNGEDLFTLDPQAMTWKAKSLLTYPIVKEWNSDPNGLNHVKFVYHRYFLSLVNESLQCGDSFPKRTELPSVSLLQKTSSSPITCHATGFYPNSAVLFWRKDEEELYEEVDHGEILPNPDGTFQMSVALKLPSESSSDWGRYECVFQLSGVKEDMVTKLDKAVIRSNEATSAGLVVGVAVGVAVGLLLLLSVCIGGFLIWSRKNNRCQQANKKQSESEEEAELNQETDR